MVNSKEYEEAAKMLFGDDYIIESWEHEVAEKCIICDGVIILPDYESGCCICPDCCKRIKRMIYPE